eukprot:scaffold438_cov250-Pinguiococcus_pyrenoidosus.AAC.8
METLHLPSYDDHLTRDTFAARPPPRKIPPPTEAEAPETALPDCDDLVMAVLPPPVTPTGSRAHSPAPQEREDIPSPEPPLPVPLAKLRNSVRRVVRYKRRLAALESRDRAQISRAAQWLHQECQWPDRAAILHDVGAVGALAKLILLDATTAFGNQLVTQSLQDLAALCLNRACAQDALENLDLVAEFDDILKSSDRHDVVVRLTALIVCRALRPESAFDPPPQVDSPAYGLLLTLLDCAVPVAIVEALTQLDEYTQDVDFADAVCRPTEDHPKGDALLEKLVPLIASEDLEESYAAVRVLRNIACNIGVSDNIVVAMRHLARKLWHKLLDIAERSGIRVVEQTRSRVFGAAEVEAGPGEKGDKQPASKASRTRHPSMYDFSTQSQLLPFRKGGALYFDKHDFGADEDDKAHRRHKYVGPHASIRRSEEICTGEAAMECVWYLGAVYSRSTGVKKQGNFPEDAYSSLYKTAAR